MDYIDIVNKNDKYRGIMRELSLNWSISRSQKKRIQSLYDYYWTNSSSGCVFSHEVLKKYIELKGYWAVNGIETEIIVFSDDMSKENNFFEFVGWEVFGDYFSSPLEEGNIIDDRFKAMLNKNGIFSSYECAEQFLTYWQSILDNHINQWEYDKNIRVFKIWSI